MRKKAPFIPARLHAALVIHQEAEKAYETNRAVWNLHQAACDNAAQTVGFLKVESGEYYDMYLASVRDLLTARDTSEAVKKWFARRAVTG